MNSTNEFIKIKFKKKFLNKFDTLYFIPNSKVIYFNDNHINYIFEKELDNIIYTFYGFYKDDYFLIIFDSFNKDIDVTIHHKELLLLNLNWTLNYDFNGKNLYTIDKNLLCKKYNAILLNNRNIFLKENIRINDYLKIYDYSELEVKINLTNSIKDSFLSRIIKKIY